MSVMDSASWPSAVLKGLSVVFLDQYRGNPSMLPLLYRFKKAEQSTEQDLETGDVGAVSEFQGEVAYDDAKEGYKKSISETEYALGLKATRRLIRNDLYGVLEDRVRLLSDSFRDLRESRGAYPFVNAFNGSFTVGDGLSLCNAAHTSKYGGSSQSNTTTNALSAANLEAARIASSKLKTNRDNDMVNEMDTILVPIDLEAKAFEIVKSMGQVDSANNNRNFSYGRYNIIVWPNKLTSTTNWFLLNSKRMKQQLIFREWEAVQFFRSGEFDTLVSKFAGYCSFGISSVEWRWIYGSSAS